MIYPSLSSFLEELKENCLLLARHGESDWNSLSLIQGQQDRPLSPRGFQQRKNLFFSLRQVQISRIYTSQLQRTIQTAQPLSEEKNIPLERTADFNEAKLGIFEGEHNVHFSDDFSKAMYTEFLNDEINIILPGGGENLRMVDQRVRKPLPGIMSSLENSGHILVVAHRNVNKMIVKNLLGLSFEEGYQVEQKNHWLYVFAPKKRGIWLIKITAANEEISIQEGYGRIEK